MTNWRQWVYRMMGVAVLLGAAVVRAAPGVDSEQLRIAMVNAQSGPAAELGRAMHAGAQAYFARINAAGGVHGRQLNLLLRDDGYEPARTARLTEELLAGADILALFGYVGTPTSRAALPAALAAEVPYLFPLSGAKVLREPLHRMVFNVRAAYFAETQLLVRQMTEVLGLSRIALVMQDDSFGATVQAGLAAALQQRGSSLVGEVRIRRNALDMSDAARQLRDLRPQAIFFIGTHRQLAAIIREVRTLGSGADFFSVSFVGSEAFVAEAGAAAEGVYIAQVVPSPEDLSLPLVREYRAAMRGPFSHASLEGYIGAAVLVEALQRAGPQPTRDKLVEVLESLDIDLGGFAVRFGPGDHQGSDMVWLTRIEQGRALPVVRQP